MERFEAGYQNDIRAYCGRIIERYGDRLQGVLLFGSLARGEARPYDSLESDIDLIVVIEGLPPLSPRVLEKIEVEKGIHTLVCAVWMTPAELAEHIQAKAGYILDAFDEGLILYDRGALLAQSRARLTEELQARGVVRTESGWSFPLKAGEEYVF